jgi:hypothetical protein
MFCSQHVSILRVSRVIKCKWRTTKLRLKSAGPCEVVSIAGPLVARLPIKTDVVVSEIKPAVPETSEQMHTFTGKPLDVIFFECTVHALGNSNERSRSKEIPSLPKECGCHRDIRAVPRIPVQIYFREKRRHYQVPYRASPACLRRAKWVPAKLCILSQLTGRTGESQLAPSRGWLGWISMDYILDAGL